MPTKKQIEIRSQKFEALRGFVRASDGPFDPDSLSRSYGLPRPDVERIIRSNQDG